MIVRFLWALILVVSPFYARAAALIPASFAETAKLIRPAVVNLSIEKKMGVSALAPFGRNGMEGDEFFRRFYGDAPHEFKQSSLGSGVIVDALRGMVLTNNHVVEGADSIHARLHDGTEVDAILVGTDPKTDLAVLKLEDPKNLFAARFGDSDALEVGDWVLAVGSPFGLEQTVSQGIVSAKGRVIGAGPYDNFLQTDAAINPGNSGGPLVDLKGEVIGINTAISTRSGGSEGIGFAIPASMARKVYEELVDKGRVTRGWLGVNIQQLSPTLNRHFGMAKDQKGVIIADVQAGTPAEKAGFKAGDVLLSYEGKPVGDPRELQRRVAESSVGKPVPVVIWRDKAEKTLRVKVGELKDRLDRPRGRLEDAGAKEEGPRLGIEVEALESADAERLGLKAEQGVLVLGVRPGGPAEEAGLRRGDVILELDKARITSPEELKRLTGKLKPGQEVVLKVYRDGHSQYLAMNLEAGK
jgi:serine protease Do